MTTENSPVPPVGNVRYLYLREKPAKGHRRGKPFGCIAYTVDDQNILYFGVSTVHPDDKFDRKLARTIARGRMYSASENCTAYLGPRDADNCTKNSYVVKQIYLWIANAPSAICGSKAIKAAERWFKGDQNQPEEDHFSFPF